MWFRCFQGKHNSLAYKFDLIKEGILFCKNLFPNDCHVIFLADRWFPHKEILSYIQSTGAFFCIRVKSFLTFSYYDKHGYFRTKHLRDITPWSYSARYFENVYFTRKKFLTNIVVSKANSSGEAWILATNDSPNRAVKNYSYRFGSIESIFKNQKSNRLQA